MTLKILQICHGPIIPEYTSAYSLRCHSLISRNKRKIVSVGGAIFRDSNTGSAYQYHSIILMVFSLIKGNRAFEIYLSQGKFLRRKYINSVKREIIDANIVVFEGPWQYKYFKKYLPGKLIVYDAHNSETDLRKGNPYQEYVRNLETEILKECNLVFCVAKKDSNHLQEMANLTGKKFHYAPILLNNTLVDWHGRDSKEITFIGSMYGPNLSALAFTMQLARELPDFTFNIVGSVTSTKFRNQPPNIKVYGVLSEAEKSNVLSKSMFALNPVNEGSGRNVKVLDYLRHQCPIITTRIGFRGFEEYEHMGGIIVVDRNEFKDNILRYASNRNYLNILSAQSRKVYNALIQKESIFDPEEVMEQEYYKLHQD